MAWTADEKAAIVRAFCEEGETASVIARRHNTTRNAILGLVHRHRLKSDRTSRPPKVAAAASAHHKQAARQVARRPRMPSWPRLVRTIDDRLVVLPPAIRALPIADLVDGECRFAVTPHDGRPTEHRFCGAPADGSFCAYHRRLVFNLV